jgi:hypothetical protein
MRGFAHPLTRAAMLVSSMPTSPGCKHVIVSFQREAFREAFKETGKQVELLVCPDPVVDPGKLS